MTHISSAQDRAFNAVRQEFSVVNVNVNFITCLS